MAISAESYPGFSGGMRPGIPAWQLNDNEAQYLQDSLVDMPGLTRQRGPVDQIPATPSFSYKGSALLSTLNPRGQVRFAVLNGDGSNGKFSVLSDDAATKIDLTWPHNLPTNPAAGASSAYRLVDAKPGLNGGLLVGVSSAFDAAAPQQALGYWWGANKPDFVHTIIATRGSRTVTGGGFTANVVPGMFLYANTDSGFSQVYLGLVVSVESDTSLTLGAPSTQTANGQSATFKSLRGIAPRISKGRITCSTDNPTVNGGDTKFLRQGLNTGTWQLFRRHDYAFIGQVSSVASDISLQLTGNAAISMADDAYYAINVNADFSLPITDARVGWITANYANRQWYFNQGTRVDKTYRVYFSEEVDFEALDLSEDDGDWFPISSTGPVQEDVRAAMPVYNGLMVMKETETFIITGLDPTTFRVDKLWGDGVLSPMSVQSYEGGAIWAGRSGIHYYDGQQVMNIMADKFGDVWKTSLQTFDPTRYRMWSSIVHNHYILHIEKLNPSIGVTKGNTSTTPDYWNVVINLDTMAVTMATNLRIRGSVTLPAQQFRGVWLLMNDSSSAKLVRGDSLFDQEGADDFGADGGAAGPDWFIESKKFDMGDPLRLKRIKQLAVNYLVQGTSLKVDTVLGLNETAKTLTTEMPSSVYTWDKLHIDISTWDQLKTQFPTWNSVVNSIFVPMRMRFLKRSQFFSFRIYPHTSPATRAKLGPFQLGYKLMRLGRV